MCSTAMYNSQTSRADHLLYFPKSSLLPGLVAHLTQLSHAANVQEQNPDQEIIELLQYLRHPQESALKMLGALSRNSPVRKDRACL